MFTTRTDAGTNLAKKLVGYKGLTAVVLGLPRGGVVVASVVSQKLGLPLDVLVIKKIPSILEPELGIGALAPDNVSFVSWKLAHRVGADEAYLRIKNQELNDQIKKKILLYRKGRRPLDVKNKIVIVVDDGAATGATLEVAILWLRKKKAGKIVVAVPVAPISVVSKIKPEVHELVVIETPDDFSAVGQFYKEFPQVEDEEVVKLLRQ
ncbi:hypothetical protein A3A79_02315 [Candidatus Gottesmanbacteria bacterium RIFCSPLOWO2_01_FULL_43_11b]|uniref:Phosphoribosyltransferase domain-containing protein n=1 Tax=Candidatus Gottesmanbacteria bacterium RIFCSPLOWO2_01_FULL_43_11b TaxID=1798392 RepID=A0A1F6AGX3_9BACT|nr:MAG: hypothetical protein A3A79_02315 [Candidatus Gottesmanbacteria bacterium RIFCSPLOWO2_01_FULL_43_11b]